MGSLLLALVLKSQISGPASLVEYEVDHANQRHAQVFASLRIDKRGFHRSFHGQRPFVLRSEGQVRCQQIADLLSHGLLLLDRLKREILFVDQASPRFQQLRRDLADVEGHAELLMAIEDLQAGMRCLSGEQGGRRRRVDAIEVSKFEPERAGQPTAKAGWRNVLTAPRLGVPGLTRSQAAQCS